MNRRWTIFLTVTLVVFVLLYFGLVMARIVTPDALSGFLGVLVGGVLVEISRHWSEEAERTNQFRLAALEKRLEAHQEAYSLWRKLLANMNDNDKIVPLVITCQDWWDDHCLYLEPVAREAFLKAFHAASDHSQFLSVHADAKLIKETAQEVKRAGDLIVRGVALPSIAEIESKQLQQKRSK